MNGAMLLIGTNAITGCTDQCPQLGVERTQRGRRGRALPTFFIVSSVNASAEKKKEY